jgi:hypothetical protein
MRIETNNHRNRLGALATILSLGLTALPAGAAVASEQQTAAEAPAASQLYSLLQEYEIAHGLDMLAAGDYAHPGLADAAPGAIEDILEQAGDDPEHYLVDASDPSTLVIVNQIRDFSAVLPGNQASRSEIEESARRLLARLGIEEFDVSDLRVRRLMRATSETPDAATPLAYRVFGDLRISNARVVGPKILIGYYLDGVLQKARIQWPEMEMDRSFAGVSWATERIVPQVRPALAAHPLGHIDGPLRFDVVLDLQQGLLRPMVTATGMLSDGAGSGRWGVLEIPVRP